MIRVVLQDESASEINPGIDVPSEILARLDDDRFACLRFVDPYGDTIFNRLPCEAYRASVFAAGIPVLATTHEALIRQVESLAAKCETGCICI